MLLARVHILLPAEAQIALAIIGAVIVALFLFTWYFGTFGKKGLIALGTALALFVVGVGAYLVIEQLGYRDDARVRQEQARANALRLKRLLDARPTSDQPVEKACSAFIAPEPRAGASRPPAAVTLAWASDAPAQELLHLTFGAERHRLTDLALDSVPPDLERALRPEFFFVARKERVDAGWRVTVIIDRQGTSCTGSVVTQRVPDDDELVAIGLCKRLGRVCGAYDKQFSLTL